MSRCVVCAQPTLGRAEVCVVHLDVRWDDWATGNRIICNFLHRGIIPPAPCELAGALES